MVVCQATSSITDNLTRPKYYRKFVIQERTSGAISFALPKRDNWLSRMVISIFALLSMGGTLVKYENLVSASLTTVGVGTCLEGLLSCPSNFSGEGGFWLRLGRSS